MDNNLAPTNGRTGGGPPTFEDRTAEAAKHVDRVDFKAWLDKARGSIEEVSSRYLSPDRLFRIALVARQRNPLLLKCTPQSFLLALMDAATAGVEPNTPLNHAALVPYRNSKTNNWEVEFQFMKMGLIHLARRSGLVRTVRARLVYEREYKDPDRWEWVDGSDLVVRHRPLIDGDPGPVVAAYAVADMYDGEPAADVMRIDQLERVRAKSKAQNGPWKTDTEQMYKKTVIKRLLSGMDLDADTARAIAVERDEPEDQAQIEMFAEGADTETGSGRG